MEKWKRGIETKGPRPVANDGFLLEFSFSPVSPFSFLHCTFVAGWITVQSHAFFPSGSIAFLTQKHEKVTRRFIFFRAERRPAVPPARPPPSPDRRWSGRFLP